MKTLGIYIRVSSDEQVRKGNSLETQTKRGIEVARELKWNYKIYEEPGLSATLTLSKLPSLKELIKDAKEGEINGFAIIEFSRISRNDENWTTIKNVLKKKKITLFIDGIDYDLNDPTVELTINFQQNLAVYEVQRLSQRVKRGLRTGVQKGRVGGGTIPFGYTKSEEDKTLIIYEEESKVVKEIFDLCIQGHGTKSIATILNDKNTPTKYSNLQLSVTVNGNKRSSFIWKDGQIYGVLTNPIYCGKRKFKDLILNSPIIIQPNVFLATQKLLSTRNRFKNTTNKYFYLLKGLIVCGKCGSKMNGYIKPTRGMREYKCNSKRNHISHNCGSRAINLDKLNRYVIEEVKKLPKRLETGYEFFGKFTFNKKLKQLSELKIKIEALDRNLDQTYELDIPSKGKEKMINYLSNKKTPLQKKMDLLTTEVKYWVNRNELIQNVTKMVDPLNSSEDNNIHQKVLRSIIDRIEVSYVTKTKKPYYLIVLLYQINNISNVVLGTEFQISSMKHSVLKHQLNLINIGGGDLPLKIDINIDDAFND